MKKFSKSFSITMTGITLFTITIMSVMDLNATHMTNPLWPPHARFHWAVQYFSALTVSLLTLFAIWSNYKDKGSRLSILFIGLSPLFFWGMFFPALLMPGTGTWPDGVTPPQGFPEILKTVHPNLIMACVLSIASIWLTTREYKKRRVHE
jgi:hypothetical protein